MKSPRILLVDDDTVLRALLAQEFAALGLEVNAVADGEEAMGLVDEFGPDAALIDLRLPGMDGIELLRRLLAWNPDLPVVMLTGHGSVPRAVEAMRRGAYDFLTKPISLDVLDQTLRRALERSALVAENKRLRELVGLASPTGILGESRPTVELRALVQRIAATDAGVLVLGENGTGKELVARAVHEQSDRRDHPFVVVNCGAIPEDLVESELFGHERGAFTNADRKRLGLLQTAHLGTILLDEVGELPLSVQPVLLRALQFGEVRPVGSSRTLRVDVRVIAATNRDLLAEVEAGRFREDLYYRIATLVVEIPPLRERREDIDLLARFFLERHNAVRPPERRLALGPEALARLRAHDWPGNVRELENAITRIAALVENCSIGPEAVENLVLSRRKRNSGPLPTLDFQELERMAVVQALRLHRGNRRSAAAELGVAVQTLYNKLRAYNVSEHEFLVT